MGTNRGSPAALLLNNRVYLQPPAGSLLAAVLEREPSSEQALAAIFTLAGAESVREVRVEGSVVYRSDGAEEP
jgi:hypothetical protein